MSIGQILFGFSGRLNRAKYWLVFLFWMILLMIAILAIVFSFPSTLEAIPETGNAWQPLLALARQGDPGALLIILLSIPSMISGFAIGIKRLHDRNRSGWWVLLFFVFPLVASDETLLDSLGTPLNWAVAAASLGFGLWGFIELGFLRGTSGPNQYGPDPLPPAAPAPTAA